MEKLPNNVFLQFNSDTLEAVRKEFNLDKPGRLDEAIDVLDNWLMKQNHFVKKDFSRDYLEITLITAKGLVERAKLRIDKLCTFKSLMPQFYNDTDVRNLSSISRIGVHGHLPKMTKDHYRVYILKGLSEDFDSTEIIKYYKYIVMCSEYLKKHDYCMGFILIVDCRDLNPVTLATKFNPVELRQAMTVFMEGYGMRLHSFHVITPSKMVDALVTLFKSVVSPKIGNRVHVHKTVDTLYDTVPRDILPTELGGEEISLKKINEKWIEILSSDDFMEYFIEMKRATTDESCRQTDNFNENYMGTPGSFRSFSVD